MTPKTAKNKNPNNNMNADSKTCNSVSKGESDDTDKCCNSNGPMYILDASHLRWLPESRDSDRIEREGKQTVSETISGITGNQIEIDRNKLDKSMNAWDKLDKSQCECLDNNRVNGRDDKERDDKDRDDKDRAHRGNKQNQIIPSKHTPGHLNYPLSWKQWRDEGKEFSRSFQIFLVANPPKGVIRGEAIVGVREKWKEITRYSQITRYLLFWKKCVMTDSIKFKSIPSVNTYQHINTCHDVW
jgi:hypothetical protein